MQDSRSLQMRIQVLGDVKLNCWYFLILQREAVIYMQWLRDPRGSTTLDCRIEALKS
jgi:hypothetical protein